MTDFVKDTMNIVNSAFGARDAQLESVERSTAQTLQSLNQAEQLELRQQEAERRGRIVARQEEEAKAERMAARSMLARFSHEINEAENLPYKPDAILTHMTRVNEMGSVFNPNAAGIDPRERASRNLMRSKIGETGQKLVDNVFEEYRTVTVDIPGLGRPATYQDLQSLLAAPGREGDVAREYLAQGDPAKLQQLVTNPAMIGKVEMLRDPEDGGPILLTARDALRFKELDAALTRYEAGFVQSTGIDARTIEGAAMLGAQRELAAEMGQSRMERLKANREHLRTREETLVGTVLEGTTLAVGPTGDMSSQPSGQAMSLLSYDPFVIRSEKEVADTMTGVEGMEVPEAKSIALGVLKLGKVSATFEPTVQYFQDVEGMTPAEARREAFDEVRTLANIERDFQRLRSTSPNGALLTIEPLLDSGLSAFQVRNRISLLQNAPKGTARIALSEVIYADAKVSGKTDPQTDLAQMNRLEQAAVARMSLPTMNANELVSLPVEELRQINTSLGGQPVPDNILNAVTRATMHGDRPAPLKARAAVIGALAQTQDLAEFSSLLASGTYRNGQVPQEISRSIKSAQFNSLTSRDQGQIGLAMAPLLGRVRVATGEIQDVTTTEALSGTQLAQFRNPGQQARPGRAASDGLGGTPAVPAQEAIPPSLETQEVPVGENTEGTTRTVTRNQNLGTIYTVPDEVLAEAKAELRPLFQKIAASGQFSPDETYSEVRQILHRELMKGAKTPDARSRASVLASKVMESLEGDRVRFKSGEALSKVAGNTDRILNGETDLSSELRDLGMTITKERVGGDGQFQIRVGIDPSSSLGQNRAFRNTVMGSSTYDRESGQYVMNAESMETVDSFLSTVLTEVQTVAQAKSQNLQVPFRPIGVTEDRKRLGDSVALDTAQNLFSAGGGGSNLHFTADWRKNKIGFGVQSSKIGRKDYFTGEGARPFHAFSDAVFEMFAVGKSQEVFDLRNDLAAAVDGNNAEAVRVAVTPAYTTVLGMLEEMEKGIQTADRSPRFPDPKVIMDMDALQDFRVTTVIQGINPELLEAMASPASTRGRDAENLKYTREDSERIRAELRQTLLSFNTKIPGIHDTYLRSLEEKAPESAESEE